MMRSFREMVVDFDLENPSCGGIQCCFPEILGHHFTQAFKSHHFGFPRLPCSATIRARSSYHMMPNNDLSDIDAIQRRNRNKDSAIVDQSWHVSVKEGQKEGRDVMTIGGASASRMIRSYRNREMSISLPIPHPRAVTKSWISLFSRTFERATDSVFNTLPRSGRIA